MSDSTTQMSDLKYQSKWPYTLPLRIVYISGTFILYIYFLRNYDADWSWCFFGRELVAYSNITSDAFFDEISKNFAKSIRSKIRQNIGFTPMPKMDGHVANYPVAGKTGCPVIISKYSEAEKIKDRVNFTFWDRKRSYEVIFESIKKRYPDAIGIGFAKSGTGTMVTFDCHSNIVYSDIEGCAFKPMAKAGF